MDTPILAVDLGKFNSVLSRVEEHAMQQTNERTIPMPIDVWKRR
jgi:hypothetical protein